MKKGLFILAVIVMAFGNASFAQNEAYLRSKVTDNVMKHYGLRDEITVVPETCLLTRIEGDSARSTYMYDEYDYYLIEELYSMTLNGQWLDFIKMLYDYDFAGNVLQKLTQMDVMGNGNWQDAELASYSYEGGELSEVIIQSKSGNDWVNKTKEVYNYNGDVTTVLYWDWNGTTWTSNKLYTYTYSGTTMELLIQYMQGGAWQNEEKDTHTFDFDENIIEIIIEDWIDENWVNVKRTTYNYEGNVYTSRLIEEWDGAAWESTYRSSYVYEDGNATLGKCEMMSEGQWVPGNGSVEIAYGYNAAFINLNCNQAEVKYIDLTGIEEGAQAVGFKVYPIPAENEIQIEAKDFQKAEIYSVTGQKLMESMNDRMNVSTLASGIYVMKVYDHEGGCATQRFMVK